MRNSTVPLIIDIYSVVQKLMLTIWKLYLKKDRLYNTKLLFRCCSVNLTLILFVRFCLFI